MSSCENLIPPSDAGEFPHSGYGPIPLDGRIREGFQLPVEPDEQVLLGLAEHTNQAFDEMRSDKTREYGRCIAYITGAQPATVAELDHFFAGVAQSQNHGMLETDPDQTKDGVIVWQGEDGARQFKLRKYPSVYIVMMDGSVHEGTLYGLFSAVHAAKFTPRLT
jgi:hypothetical protein